MSETGFTLDASHTYYFFAWLISYELWKSSGVNTLGVITTVNRLNDSHFEIVSEFDYGNTLYNYGYSWMVYDETEIDDVAIFDSSFSSFDSTPGSLL